LETFTVIAMLSNSDLRYATKKLEQRSQQATEKAQRKIEKERLLAERKARQQETIEREIHKRRVEELEREEREREERERLLEVNDGVLYRGEFQPVPAPEALAKAKGIKRASDKILLPSSVGKILLDQEAHKKGGGGYFFELESLDTGRRTFSSVLDFTAAEGFVALPEKVAKCLFGIRGEAWEDRMSGRIRVTYKKLQKGTKVVFQPREKSFQMHPRIQDDIRGILEGCLSRYSCLSVGDWVTVSVQSDSNGANAVAGDGQVDEFDLRVKELEIDNDPVEACSIIDTDLEAEIHPSIETEDRIFQEELRARQLIEERERREREEVQVFAEARRKEEEYHARHADMVKQRAESLPDEPCSEDAIVIVVRFPNGEKHRRAYLPSDPVGLLFCFVDSKGASGLMPRQYRLVSQFPRFEIEYCEVNDVGKGTMDALECLKGGSSVLFLEKL
jgi:ubiquitin fusion degradation protein 1